MLSLNDFINLFKNIFNEQNNITEYIKSVFLVGSILKKQEDLGDIDVILIIKPYKIKIINEIGKFFQSQINYHFTNKELVLFWNPYCAECKIHSNKYKNSIFINLIPHSANMIESPYFERSALIFISWMKEHLTIFGKEFFENKRINLNCDKLINGERGLNFTLLELRKTAFFIRENFKEYDHFIEKEIGKTYKMVTKNINNLFLDFDDSFKFQTINKQFKEIEDEFIEIVENNLENMSSDKLIMLYSNLEKFIEYFIYWIEKNHPNQRITYSYKNSTTTVS